MMHKCIEIFFDSFTNELLDQELIINENLINLEYKESLPIITKLFKIFYDSAKEIKKWKRIQKKFSSSR